MSHAIAPGPLPPRPGLEREEPELAYEDDIPADDGTQALPDEVPAESQEESARQVERE